MEGTIITTKDPTLKKRVESLLAKGDIVLSPSAPVVESPFPLWIYKNTIKLWIGDRWKNVGEFFFSSKGYKETRVSDGLLRIKE